MGEVGPVDGRVGMDGGGVVGDEGEEGERLAEREALVCMERTAETLGAKLR